MNRSFSVEAAWRGGRAEIIPVRVGSFDWPDLSTSFEGRVKVNGRTFAIMATICLPWPIAAINVRKSAVFPVSAEDGKPPGAAVA
ncbi:hypothetical protein KYK29_18065 [Shinella daejeonensis]|uniref:hypothetical protein n=1 Tax=Shinella daejeonensis TaxID=659017 RepID=UPI0020C79761|nr:hypothetical protein [Shinella daejeonensis]MCP8896836.1 hypothetical protein [Shinella daejeonensis]